MPAQPRPGATPERMYTMEQAAELLQVSPETVRRWVARGQLRARRFGPRVIRIDAADLAGRPVTRTRAV